MAQLSADAFLEKSNQCPILDVRSPAEYAAGHITGAHSFPLFDNQERAQVGTTYKQIGSYEALLVGLELVGPKMRELVEVAHSLAPDKKVLVHCWRGGMRSQSVAWLLHTAGLSAHTLAGGYKAYRNHALASFRDAPQLIVLGGATGSGKTAMLQALRDADEQVIDLEALAHHRGSAFGGIGQGPPPTTEQFQNDLYQAWHALDCTRRIWVEDESFTIGSVKLPLELWETMQAQPLIVVDVPASARVQRLVEEYGTLDRFALAEAIEGIRKRLGGLRTQQAQQALSDGRLAEVAQYLLTYYDKSYAKSLRKNPQRPTIHINTSTGSAQQNAAKVLEAARTLSYSSLT